MHLGKVGRAGLIDCSVSSIVSSPAGGYVVLHDLITADPTQCDTSCSPLLASMLCDLYSDLIKLQTAALDEGSEASTRSDFGIRDSVQRLLEIRPGSAVDMVMKECALELIKEVLGVQHEHYLALWRNLGNSPHELDWEHVARETLSSATDRMRVLHSRPAR